MHAEQAYLFRHTLLRDAAYQLQLPADRARLHALALEVMEGVLTPAALDACAEELAQHAARAQFDAPSASLQARELGYLKRAAEHARARYRNDDFIRLFDAVADHAACPRAERAEARRQCGEMAVALGRVLLANQRLDEALALAAECGAELRGDVLITQAILHRAQGRMEQARVALSEATSIFEAMKNRRRLGQALGNLANIELACGNHGRAEEHYSRALALLEEEGHEGLANMQLANLALLFQETGRFAEAEARYKQALETLVRRGDRRREAPILGNFGTLCQKMGRLDEAERTFVRAIEISREVGNRRVEGVNLTMLGGLEREQGRVEQARRMHEQALAIHRETGNRVYEGVALGCLAEIAAETDAPEACRLFEQAVAIHRATNNRRSLGSDLAKFATLLMRQGEGAQAQQVWSEAEAVLRAVGNQEELARAQAAMRNSPT